MEVTIDKDLVLQELYEALADILDVLSYEEDTEQESEGISALLAKHESAYKNAVEALYL